MTNRKKYVQMEADTAIAAAVTLWMARSHMAQVIRESKSEVLGDWFAEDINGVAVVKDALMQAVNDAGLVLEDVLRVIEEVRDGGVDHE